MSFIQKVGINIIFILINFAHYLERKLITFLKHSSIVVLYITIFLFILLNITFLKYFSEGFLLKNNNFYYAFSSTKYPSLSNIKAEPIYPVKLRELPPANLSSKVALVVDKKTDKVLYDLNKDESLASASTTKLMTALVAQDLYSLDQKVLVTSVCTEVDGTKVGLVVGKQYTVSDLLKALLIQSGADAACVLASGSKSYPEFVYLMNKKALDLGMKSTSFTNPIGLDGINGTHYSSAWDLYVLSKVSTSNDIISNIVSTKEDVIKTSDGDYPISLTNTNKLLWDIPNTVGIKTGTTAAAGEVLLYEYFEKEKNIDIVIVVMNSTDRFADTKSLLSWTLSSYSWDVVTD